MILRMGCAFRSIFTCPFLFFFFEGGHKTNSGGWKHIFLAEQKLNFVENELLERRPHITGAGVRTCPRNGAVFAGLGPKKCVTGPTTKGRFFLSTQKKLYTANLLPKKGKALYSDWTLGARENATRTLT